VGWATSCSIPLTYAAREVGGSRTTCSHIVDVMPSQQRAGLPVAASVTAQHSTCSCGTAAIPAEFAGMQPVGALATLHVAEPGRGGRSRPHHVAGTPVAGNRIWQGRRCMSLVEERVEGCVYPMLAS
jgi:hypothetical protein